MKKLLFSLVAAGACGGVIAAPAATADFSSYTVEAAFDVTKQDDGATEVSASTPGYWTIDTSSEPEMTIKANVKANVADNYLHINTGSTPLWRTFGAVGNTSAATSGNLPAGEPADGKVVSSKVKLTACTEWPDLTDFAAKGDDPGEKLALFLFVPEEGDTTAPDEGLYAVGGKQTDSGLQPEAYLLTGATVTAGDWVTVTIKTYGDINKTSGNDKLPGFVVAVNNTVLKRSVATGLSNDDLNPTVAARNTIGSEAVNGTLIPAIAYTTSANLQGLGFQGEGGIDDVNLAADPVDGMADAVSMTVEVTGAEFSGIKLGANGAYSFTSSDEVTITLIDVANKIVTVNYANAGEAKAAYDKDAYTVTFTPVKDATLTITVEDKLFDVGGVEYGSLSDALAALNAGGTLKLLAPLTMTDEANLKFETEVEVTLDLNGQTVSAVGADFVIYNTAATLTIVDNSEGTMGTIDGAVANEATLILNEGHYNGAITNDGTLTLGVGAKFLDPEGLTPPDGMKFEQGGDNYYTLVEDAGEEPEVPSVPEVPTVDEEVGKVVETEDEEGNKTATVTVTNASTSVAITIPSDYAGTVNVVVPPTVDTITGLGNASLTIKYENTDISGAFTMTRTDGTTTIALNENGVVRMTDGEEIPVKPALAATDAEGEAVAPFEVGANGPEANVKAIPGLTYELVTTDDLDSNEFGPIVGNDEVVLGAKKKATGKRVKLEDKRSNKGAKGFYKVKVSK